MRASEISAQDVAVEGVGPTVARLNGILRDIARSGLAGLLTGVLVAGIGGRIVMRLATVLEPGAVGQFTENGNRIGTISAGGSLAVLTVGMFFGLAGAVIWVVVRPWIPGSIGVRVLLAGPVALALTGISLIDGFNPDFPILGHNAAIVAMLVVLVIVSGFSIAAFDGWLERRLPQAGASQRADAAYLVLTVAGAALILPPVLLGYLAGSHVPLGYALLGTGLATLAAWAFRYRGEPAPTWLMVLGRVALLVAIWIGTNDLVSNVARALGAS